MSRYKKHIFICINKRESSLNKKSCSDAVFQIRNKFVEELRKNNLTHEVRANKSGCLGGCSFGPVIVNLPDSNLTFASFGIIIGFFPSLDID